MIVLQPNRNKVLALFLNFIPGLGFFYIGRKTRGVVYPLLFFGGILFGIFVSAATHEGFLLGVTIIAAIMLWIISMLDLLVYVLKESPRTVAYDDKGNQLSPSVQSSAQSSETERFYTIFLSFIPGLGHLQMGLMQRGLSFLIAHFGLTIMMLFLAFITEQKIFLVFLGLLPIIWLYCMFDAAQLIHRKQAGEVLEDRSLFDQWETGREEGKRSKVLATLLSAFPGAGHMYLGLQKRGLQLMIIFLGSVYILDILRLSLFLFFIPVIWFYSFFDGLQQTSKYGRETITDRPIVEGFINHQRWLGVGLLLLGLYYISMNFFVPVLDVRFPELGVRHILDQYLTTFVVSILLISGGIKLLFGSNAKRKVRKDQHVDEYEK
ncbi:hypothetical protein [Paenibacillus sediminis]|uniref:hypothetical protein n=1 Tax=Paenibacillus sediminis TaxID=664909 RepID=UPI0039EC584B